VNELPHATCRQPGANSFAAHPSEAHGYRIARVYVVPVVHGTEPIAGGAICFDWPRRCRYVPSLHACPEVSQALGDNSIGFGFLHVLQILQQVPLGVTFHLLRLISKLLRLKEPVGVEFLLLLLNIGGCVDLFLVTGVYYT